MRYFADKTDITISIMPDGVSHRDPTGKHITDTWEEAHQWLLGELLNDIGRLEESTNIATERLLKAQNLTDIHFDHSSSTWDMKK